MNYMHGNELHADGNINDFDDFMLIVKELWDSIHSDCRFIEQEGTQNLSESLELPAIMYDLISRKHTDKLSDGRKPRQMKQYLDPDNPKQYQTELTEWFDCLGEFHIYGNTKLEAKEWKRKFEFFMLTYTGYFKKLGISDITFISELRPEVSTENRQELPHRTLRYLVRIQRIEIIKSAEIQDIHTKAFVQHQSGNLESHPTSEAADFLRLFNQNYKDN